MCNSKLSWSLHWAIRSLKIYPLYLFLPICVRKIIKGKLTINKFLLLVELSFQMMSIFERPQDTWHTYSESILNQDASLKLFIWIKSPEHLPSQYCSQFPFPTNPSSLNSSRCWNVDMKSQIPWNPSWDSMNRYFSLKHRVFGSSVTLDLPSVYLLLSCYIVLPNCWELFFFPKSEILTDSGYIQIITIPCLSPARARSKSQIIINYKS